MNLLVVPTAIIATVLFALGAFLAGRRPSGTTRVTLYSVALLLATPSVIFVVYYFRVFGEAVWLYEFRSVPFTELCAGGAGLLGGLLFEQVRTSPRIRRLVGPWFVVFITLLLVVGPYLKPVIAPARWGAFHDQWNDGVCLQTSESSCGPACAATLLRQLGKSVTEEQMARESFTGRTGTENWYLARTLRRHGAKVSLIYQPGASQPWPVPSIAGVQLSSFGKSGHFITLLARDGDNYVIGDPLYGRSVNSRAKLIKIYRFTGFFMAVK